MIIAATRMHRSLIDFACRIPGKVYVRHAWLPLFPSLLSGTRNVIFSTLKTLELGSVALSTPSLAPSHASASILPNRFEVEVIVHKTFEQQQHGHSTATALMDGHDSGSSNSENEQIREKPKVRSLGDDVLW